MRSEPRQGNAVNDPVSPRWGFDSLLARPSRGSAPLALGSARAGPCWALDVSPRLPFLFARITGRYDHRVIWDLVAICVEPLPP